MSIKHSECIFCKNSLYKLSDGMLKCSSCKRKYSPLKLERDLLVIEAYINNLSIRAASIELNLSYESVRRRYEKLRSFTTGICEDAFDTSKYEEFEEYCFSYAKDKNETAKLFRSYNFITFSAKEGVYNLMLPALSRFEDKLDDAHEQIALLKRFMRNTHIGKLKCHENTISEFWRFFEEYMSRFKGVNSKNFGIYLKEAEFKFNHSKDRQKELLKSAWIESLR
jgi:hypothetical protein